MVPFVSIDPGVVYCACAWWFDKALDEVDIVHRETWVQDLRHDGYGTMAIIERPQIYRHGKAKTKDVEGLLIASGEIASQFDQVVWYRPAMWKGQQSKTAHHKKIRAALTQEELKVLEKRSKTELKHILDAVGLGLFHLGRLT